MNPYIPYTSETSDLEEAYLNDLALDASIERWEYATRELDRLIDELKEEERNNPS